MTSYPIIDAALNICFAMLSACLACCLYRLVKGPGLVDRVISGDAISCVVMVFILLYGMQQGTALFMPAVLVTAILGFLGMVGMSKYIARGNIVYPLYTQAPPATYATHAGTGHIHPAAQEGETA